MLKEKRIFLGLTQLEASIRLGMKASTFGMIERGERAIPIDKVKDFCDVLEISMEEMKDYLIDLHISKYDL